MKHNLLIAFIITCLLIPLSCEDSVLFVDCNDCFAEKPTEATVKIKITIDNENKFVPITIYHGYIEDGEIIKQDTIDYGTYEIDLDVNKYYTVEAVYSKKGRTIHAVDGKKLRTKKDNSSCDGTCYVILGDELDVRLK